MTESKLAPSLYRFERLVDRYLELQSIIEEKQAAYRRDAEKTASNYNQLMRELEPFWSEQKSLFYDSPFEEMVWDHWVKPYIEEGGEDWKAYLILPDWIAAVWHANTTFDTFEATP